MRPRLPIAAALLIVAAAAPARAQLSVEGRLGGAHDAITYGDVDSPELDQVEHDTFVSALFDFQTRTTLIGEVLLGAKSYAGGLFPSRTGRLAVDLDLGYTFTDHRSNDAFYDYVSHAFGLSFSAAH